MNRLLNDMESLFKPLNRSILGLGSQLYHNKGNKYASAYTGGGAVMGAVPPRPQS